MEIVFTLTCPKMEKLSLKEANMLIQLGMSKVVIQIQVCLILKLFTTFLFCPLVSRSYILIWFSNSYLMRKKHIQRQREISRPEITYITWQIIASKPKFFKPRCYGLHIYTQLEIQVRWLESLRCPGVGGMAKWFGVLFHL